MDPDSENKQATKLLVSTAMKSFFNETDEWVPQGSLVPIEIRTAIFFQETYD